MRLNEIEAWALAIADRAIAHQPVEDDRVELKAAFIEPDKAARRLAGHANAARGSSLLWIIGIDDDAGTIPGVAASDFAEWWARIEALFNEVAPDVRVVNVPYDRVTMVALLINPDRAPFAVANPAHGRTGGGPVELEVPWREGTATRSARRSDLLRLLVPALTTPQIEVLHASLTLSLQRHQLSDPSGPREDDSVRLTARFYIEHLSSEMLIIPDHRTSAEVLNASGKRLLTTEGLELGTSGIRRTYSASGIGREDVRLTVERGAGQLLVHAPGLAAAWKQLKPLPTLELPEQESLQIRILLNGIRMERPIRISAVVHPQARRDTHSGVTWSMGREIW